MRTPHGTWPSTRRQGRPRPPDRRTGPPSAARHPCPAPGRERTAPSWRARAQPSTRATRGRRPVPTAAPAAGSSAPDHHPRPGTHAQHPGPDGRTAPPWRARPHQEPAYAARHTALHATGPAPGPAHRTPIRGQAPTPGTPAGNAQRRAGKPARGPPRAPPGDAPGTHGRPGGREQRTGPPSAARHPRPVPWTGRTHGTDRAPGGRDGTARGARASTRAIRDGPGAQEHVPPGIRRPGHAPRAGRH